MESYSAFAEVYDLFMDNIPYKSWSKYLISLLKEDGIKDGLVLELGCGTGSMTELMAKAGYDMIGLDSSNEMLDEALVKRDESGQDILYLCQDMREFELYGTVRAIYSVCDCMNYILDEEDLLEVFRLVNNYLDPKGLFVFDLKTEAYYLGIRETTIAENREEGSFIWENFYDEEEKVNGYDLTLFLPDGEGKYEKIVEEHYQKAYSLETIKALIRESGMEFVVAYDAFTKNPVGPDSQRIYVLAREKGK